ncbi:unnamed protein product, partial [Ectocarpus fasciculatus]
TAAAPRGRKEQRDTMEESKGGERRPVNPVDDSAMELSGGGTTDECDIPEFSLCAALVGHTGDVRSLAVGKGHLYSGARDSVVMAWPLDEDGHIDGTHVTPAAQVALPDWVNALAVKSPAGGEEVIVGGCKDGGIYAVAWDEGDPAAGAAAAGGNGAKLVVRKTLLGHNAPISSLSWTSEGLLLSGSWDETAKAWDLETGTCKWTLGGHENNVCVLGLGSGSVATGSTGLSVEGHLVGQQIRMWEGSPPKEWRSLTDHTSGIRDLCLVDAPASLSSSPGHCCFCSASNDATVRVWSEEGDCRAVVTIPDESFVFSVSHLGAGLVASADDAGNLCAARVPPPPPPPAAGSPPPPAQQTATVLYKHPKTVWSVAALRT